MTNVWQARTRGTDHLPVALVSMPGQPVQLSAEKTGDATKGNGPGEISGPTSAPG